VYPKKQAKQKAFKSWQRLTKEERGLAVEDVRRRGSTGWNKSKEGEVFIPLPATYLNGKRWEDEPVAHLSIVDKFAGDI